jgi:hypothetical protein
MMSTRLRCKWLDLLALLDVLESFHPESPENPEYQFH